MLTFFHWQTQLILRLISLLEQAFLRLTEPSRRSIVLSTAIDFTPSKADLIAENALLRQQLIVLSPSEKAFLFASRSPLARPPRQPRQKLKGIPAHLQTRVVSL